MHKRTAATATALACVAATIVGLPAVASGGGSGGSDELRPVVEGLDGARGVATGPLGPVVFSEADGSISRLKPFNRHRVRVEEIGRVPAGFVAPAVDVNIWGTTFALTGGGEPGTGAATLYRLSHGRTNPRAVADIAAYQAKDVDPYNVEGVPEESNPFGLAALPDGSVLVADAAGNDLLRVYPNGRIITVARLKPRVIEVPEGLPPEFDGEPLPPAGTPIPSEGVATSVTVGADGYYYVGELRGFPATPGTSQVWRIKPGSKNAVCDPEAPDTGACRRYVDGFTSIVDLAADHRGGIYVTELVQQSWLQWEMGLVDPPIGGLFRVPWGGGTPVELAAGKLVLPGGAAVDWLGKVWVIGPAFGPGALSLLK